MPRREQPDLALPALKRFLTTDLIHAVLAQAGRQSKRFRKLRDVAVVWLMVGLGLYRDLNVVDVLCRVADALGAGLGWTFAERPHASSITEARDRLGWGVIRTIFRVLTNRLQEQFCGSQRWHGLVVRALDGSTARVPNTSENDRWFGRPASRRGKGTSAFPQLRMVLTVDVLTHLVVGAAFGPYSISEQRLAQHAVRRLSKDTLLLLDRLYHSFVWPARLIELERLFVMRAKEGRGAIKPTHVKRLGRNDRLCTLKASTRARREFPDLPEEVRVREITVARKGHRSIVLLTNLLDRREYPAGEIAKLYLLRWEAEHCFREIKAQLMGEHVTFRSHTPRRVLQEAYGLLITYNCIRGLMCAAAAESGRAPLTLSFTQATERIRRALEPGAFEAWSLLQQIAACVLQPKRVGRQAPRVVVTRPPKYGVRRRGLPDTVGRTNWRKVNGVKRATAARNR